MLKFFSPAILVFGVLALLIADKSVMADDSQAIQSLAQSLVKTGKTEEAYQLLLKHPETNAVGYYNLGTLALQAGHMGAAIADLEKANCLKRHDPDVLHNLEIARTSLGRTLGGEGLLDPASTWTEKIADHVSLEELRGVLGLLALAVALLWIRVYLRSRTFRQVLVDPGSMLGFLTFALVAALYFVEREASARPPVVLLAHVSVRSGPGGDFPGVAELDAGVKLRELGSAHGAPSGEPLLAGAPSFVFSQPSSSPVPSPVATGGENWLQVRYSGDEIGWIPASSALVIEP
jgi:hypothetical protein